MKNIIAVTILILISINSYSQKIKTLRVGDQAFNIIGKDEMGNTIQIKDFSKEKYVLLNFTATNCGPCWKTYNIMNSVQEQYKDHLKVISFHHDDDKVKWKTIANKLKINFNCTSIWEAENKARISEIYKIDGFPYFFLIDKKGVIIDKWFGNSETKLKKVLRKRIK